MGTKIQPKKGKANLIDFPVSLLKDATNCDIHETCYNIMCFSAYKITLHLRFNDEYGKMEYASKLFNFKYNDVEKAYDTGEKIFKKVKLFFPKITIRPDIIIDFIESDKNQFEVDCFLAYCSLKSIVQLDPFKKLTKDYLFARMMGLPKASGEWRVHETYKKYDIRYHWDKLKIELQTNSIWDIKYYSDRTHGFYISFVLEYDKLVLEAQKLHKRYIEKQLRQKKEAAQKKADDELNNSTS